MPLSPRVARFNHRVTNRVTRMFDGRLPGFALLIHTGRRSGRTYRIHIYAFRDGDDYIIALVYGVESDWVRNVEAAGVCEIVTRGQHVRLTHPRTITDPTRRWAPLPARLVLELIGASQYMRLTHLPASH
ncbi:MAG TPA: nitroreductase family deazaflavin-dependent oxidoreductase [Ktedonobacterales bacterium]|nr:nitroreductase family deazaflavin-dependent oxidoreductase [Ktedonobacterales bacterium]